MQPGKKIHTDWNWSLKIDGKREFFQTCKLKVMTDGWNTVILVNLESKNTGANTQPELGVPKQIDALGELVSSPVFEVGSGGYCSLKVSFYIQNQCKYYQV